MQQIFASNILCFFKLPSLAWQVEPVTAEMLELSKLQHHKGVLNHTPSRNHQWHMYTVLERPDVRSYPLRHMYVRGLVRQLSSPTLVRDFKKNLVASTHHISSQQ